MIAHETSFSKLSQEEWQSIVNNWAMWGSDMVEKVGKKWKLPDCYGGFPLFKTKTAAYNAGTKLILAETEYRLAKRNAQTNP